MTTDETEEDPIATIFSVVELRMGVWGTYVRWYTERLSRGEKKTFSSGAPFETSTPVARAHAALISIKRRTHAHARPTVRIGPRRLGALEWPPTIKSGKYVRRRNGINWGAPADKFMNSYYRWSRKRADSAINRFENCERPGRLRFMTFGKFEINAYAPERPLSEWWYSHHPSSVGPRRRLIIGPFRLNE